ncbi:MAG: precorrin-8X methylmutase, partial [Geminicoccaceae bacterium]
MDRTCQARDYLKDPDAIYQASFAAIRDEARLEEVPQTLRPVAARLIHACGMPDIVDDLAYAGDAVDASKRSLSEGRPILVDATMVAA